MTESEIDARAKELLRQYPYDPKISASVYGSSPEALRGVPPGIRESAANIYARNEKQWRRESQLAARRFSGAPEVL